jgi:hypothetical protein
LDVSSGRFDTPYLDWSVPQTTDGWVRDVSNGGVYLNKKNIPRKADKGSLSISTTTCSSAKNFHLIRYADVLLWYAEVLIHDGEYAEAGKYINMVRARAANGYVKAVNPDTMEESSSAYVFDDLVNGAKKSNAAGELPYRTLSGFSIHDCGKRYAGSSLGTPHRDGSRRPQVVRFGSLGNSRRRSEMAM